MLHLVAAYNFEAHIPPVLRDAAPDAVAQAEAAVRVNVTNDLNWLEREITASIGAFLVGDAVTAADIVMAFSAQLTFSMLGAKLGGTWPGIDAWLGRCRETAAYKRAKARCEHNL
jgi:glutathione S-transferase